MALSVLLRLPIFFILLVALNPFTIVDSRTIESPEHPFIKTLQNLKGVRKGQTVKGVGELKSYLQKFGYLTNDHSKSTSTFKGTNEHFDENLESALKIYQTYHHLDVTGYIDAATIEKMSLPRCGVPDITQHKRNGLVIVANYTFFPGSPKWRDSKRDLTYTFRSSVNVLSTDDVRQAVKGAFESWSQVTDFSFTEITNDGADVVIGFHRGDHGDQYPFDGPGKVLAHTFAPEDGRQHYDADEQWATNPTGSNQIDFQSVALHEIDHLIGLGHSSDQDAIMYPTYEGVRRNLKQDDIDGIRALYGYN